jgi:hypothetical protein
MPPTKIPLPVGQDLTGINKLQATGHAELDAGVDVFGPTALHGPVTPYLQTGDLAYSSNPTGVPTRLPIGANGQVLTVAAGVPSWGSGGGGLSKIDDQNVVNSTVTIPATGVFPTTGFSIEIHYRAQVELSSGSLNTIAMRFNGLATNTYSTMTEWVSNTGAIFHQDSGTSFITLRLPREGGVAPDIGSGYGKIVLPGYNEGFIPHAALIHTENYLGAAFPQSGSLQFDVGTGLWDAPFTIQTVTFAALGAGQTGITGRFVTYLWP